MRTREIFGWAIILGLTLSMIGKAESPAEHYLGQEIPNVVDKGVKLTPYGKEGQVYYKAPMPDKLKGTFDEIKVMVAPVSRVSWGVTGYRYYHNKGGGCPDYNTLKTALEAKRGKPMMDIPGATTIWSGPILKVILLCKREAGKQTLMLSYQAKPFDDIAKKEAGDEINKKLGDAL